MLFVLLQVGNLDPNAYVACELLSVIVKLYWRYWYCIGGIVLEVLVVAVEVVSISIFH